MALVFVVVKFDECDINSESPESELLGDYSSNHRRPTVTLWVVFLMLYVSFVCIFQIVFTSVINL